MPIIDVANVVMAQADKAEAAIAHAGKANASMSSKAHIIGRANAGMANASVAHAGRANASMADASVANAGMANAGIAKAGVANAGRANAGTSIADAGVATNSSEEHEYGASGWNRTHMVHQQVVETCDSTTIPHVPWILQKNMNTSIATKGRAYWHENKNTSAWSTNAS